MKKNIRGKISDFLKSEEGHVGIKPPLVLGAVSAGLLLVHAMVTPSAQAHWECLPGDCPEGKYCDIQCDKWGFGSCIGTWHSHCKPYDS